MKITLLALYNIHSYAIRGFHSLLAMHGHSVKSAYFKDSIYTDGPVSDKEIDDFIKDMEPTDMVAISVHSPIFQTFKRVSASIRRQYPDCKIAVGGEHPTAMPETCLPYADYVIVGEGEKAILELADGNMPEGINGPYELWADLDSLPVGHYMGNTQTYSSARTPPAISSYMTGRGCPYSCSYCHESVRRCVHGKDYGKTRRKSVDRVIDDLRYFQKIHNIKGIFFSDPIFSTNKKWLEEFCEEFARLNMTFGCYGHATGLTEEVILMLKDAGLGNFRIGVQSGSDRIRKTIYNRKDGLNDILKVAQLLHKHKIHGSYDFIINNPYESYITLKESRNFINELPPFVQINNFELRWFPKTPLTEMALADGAIEFKDVEGQYDRFGSWDYCYAKG